MLAERVERKLFLASDLNEAAVCDNPSADLGSFRCQHVRIVVTSALS